MSLYKSASVEPRTSPLPFKVYPLSVYTDREKSAAISIDNPLAIRCDGVPINVIITEALGVELIVFTNFDVQVRSARSAHDCRDEESPISVDLYGPSRPNHAANCTASVESDAIN